MVFVDLKSQRIPRGSEVLACPWCQREKICLGLRSPLVIESDQEKKNHRSAAPRVPLPSSVYARFHGRTGPPSQSSLPFLHSLGSPQIFCGSLFCKLLSSEFNTSISSHQRAFLWSFKTKDSTLRISEFRNPRRLPDRLPIDPKPRMWTDYPINEIVPIWCYSLLNFCENCSCLEVVLCEQLGEKQNSKPGVVKRTPACPQWCWSASSCRCSFRPHCGTLTPGPVKLCSHWGTAPGWLWRPTSQYHSANSGWN